MDGNTPRRANPNPYPNPIPTHTPQSIAVLFKDEVVGLVILLLGLTQTLALTQSIAAARPFPKPPDHRGAL